MRHLIRPLARRTVDRGSSRHARARARADRIRRPLGTDHADAVARQGLDPAIRTAIAARSTVPITARSTVPSPVAATIPRLSPSDDGFAWGAATLVSSRGSRRCAPCSCVSAGCDTMAGFDTRDPEGAGPDVPASGPWHADAPVSIRPARAHEQESARLVRAGPGAIPRIGLRLDPRCVPRRARRRATAVRGGRGARGGAPRTYRGDDRVLPGGSPRRLEQPPGRLGRISRTRRATPVARRRNRQASRPTLHRATCNVGAETLGIHTIALLTDAVRLYQRLGFVRCPEFDLRAADVFPSENADEMVGLAFRRDAEPATPPRL